MAKSILNGPLYTKEGKNLGGSEPAGPQGPKSHPDPLGFLHGKGSEGSKSNDEK